MGEGLGARIRGAPHASNPPRFGVIKSYHGQSDGAASAGRENPPSDEPISARSALFVRCGHDRSGAYEMDKNCTGGAATRVLALGTRGASADTGGLSGDPTQADAAHLWAGTLTRDRLCGLKRAVRLGRSSVPCRPNCSPQRPCHIRAPDCRRDWSNLVQRSPQGRSAPEMFPWNRAGYCRRGSGRWAHSLWAIWR